MSQAGEDCRILERAPYDKVFKPMTSSKGKALGTTFPHQAGEPSDSLPSEKGSIMDPKVNCLLQFLNDIGWKQICAEFTESFRKMQKIGKGEKEVDDANTRTLQFSSWDWASKAKIKNAPREYPPILGATIFENYYTKQYRPTLLAKTTAGNFRIHLTDLLEEYDLHQTSLEPSGHAVKCLTRFEWWDNLSPGENSLGNTNEEQIFRDLERRRMLNKIVTKVQQHISAFERTSMMSVHDDTPPDSLVPAEVAHALDMLVKVFSEPNSKILFNVDPYRLWK
jgi:hypothetical protein